VAPRLHRYAARCHWSGSTAGGYDGYSRAHTVSAEPAAISLTLSADPAFHGDAELLNPEQLVVMAAASCQLLSFLASAALSGVDVLAYSDDAQGVMPEGERPERITEIRLRPRILVAAGTNLDLVRRLVGKAHENCYVANSLTTVVRVDPEISEKGT
jgi:organic hydroperoxide reductase OsmC/OhrA